MEDVRKQLDDMKKQSDEMRKLKAIIVKHENRIRALEAANKVRDEDVLDSILAGGGSNSSAGAAAAKATSASASVTSAAHDDVAAKLDSSDSGSAASPMAPDEV